MAASTIVAAPVIVLFFFTQRLFIQGIAATGLKG
jgi:ABC-type glycerol-3-phosphate transport system permease component